MELASDEEGESKLAADLVEVEESLSQATDDLEQAKIVEGKPVASLQLWIQLKQN